MTILERIVGMARKINLAELAPLLVVGAFACLITSSADIWLGLCGMALVALAYSYFKG